MPWTHLQLRPDGKVYSCCLANMNDPLGDLHKQSLPEIWNSPEMRRLRVEMMEGKKPKQCNYCYELERDTGGSFRINANQLYKHHYEPMLAGTDATGHSDKFNIVYMDFRLSNICNFRCRSCGSYASSSWHADERKMRSLKRKIWDFTHRKPEPPKFLLAYDHEEQLEDILEQVLPGLEAIYFAGGEPLLMDEHYRILEGLIARGQTKLRMNYSTNFSRLKFKKWDACDLWKKFEKVQVQASLDDSYARGEYLRKGLNWNAAVANRQRMMREVPHVEFQVSATVSAYNVWHIPDFCREWVELGYLEEVCFRLNPLYGPDHMRLQVLPPKFKEQTIQKYEKFIDEFLTRPQSRRAFQGIVEMLKSPDESNRLPELKEWTRKLDGIRSESIHKTFPELSGVF